ncbi:MAG TPA: dihydrolipoyl dehydrogenase [Blattabacteriaceae bacterium]
MNELINYDIVVIGSGPGGYISAIRASQLGFKTALVEKYNTLGGTCLNVGCIPSKAILDSSEHYFQSQKTFLNHGISFNSLTLDFQKMIFRKEKVVKKILEGLKFLLRKNKIDIYHGVGSFKEENHLMVYQPDNIVEIKFKNAIISTGSKPSDLPILRIDKKKILSSTQVLSLTEVPKRLTIIGGGVIGLELGVAYQRLGSEVSIIESSDRIIPKMDKGISKYLQKILKKIGIKFNLSSYVKEVKFKNNEVIIKGKSQGERDFEISGDYCLVAIGRKPYTEGLGLQNIGIEIDKSGYILVNKYLQTNVNNIYAIGDVIGGSMLAHKAEEEALFVIEHLSGQKPLKINYNLIPAVIYTWPEVASVGFTEEELKRKNILYKIGSFPMFALGRSTSSGDVEGFVKILASEETDEILGVHMIGARASDIIMEAVIALGFRASSEDLYRISHPHPTFSEAIRESALSAFNGNPLHI